MSTTVTVIGIILFAIVLQVFHLYISAPIRPGHVVSPGIWLTKCGVLSIYPACDNAYVTYDKNGTVKMFNAAEELVWEIDGGVCKAGDETCVPGMQVKDDNTLVVGGKTISSVKMFKDASLSPWPFAEQPKVRIYKK